MSSIDEINNIETLDKMIDIERNKINDANKKISLIGKRKKK